MLEFRRILLDFPTNGCCLLLQDADYCVTLFKREAADSECPWTYLGKHRSHYKPIRGLQFGLKLDTTAPRLISVGEDRSLVGSHMRMVNLNLISQFYI